MNMGPPNQPPPKDYMSSSGGGDTPPPDDPPPDDPPPEGDYRAEGEARLAQARKENFEASIDTSIMNGKNVNGAAQDNAMMISNQSIDSQKVTTMATVGAMAMAEGKAVTDAWRNGGG